MEIWEGPRSGVQAATDVFNADEVKERIESQVLDFTDVLTRS